MLDDARHGRDLHLAEHPGDTPARDILASDPRPGFGDVRAALLDSGGDRLEIPVRGEARGELRRDPRQRRQQGRLVIGEAAIVDPAVLNQRERPARGEQAGGLLPADVGVDPVKRGRGEQRLVEPMGKVSVLEPRVDELDLAASRRVLLGD